MAKSKPSALPLDPMAIFEPVRRALYWFSEPSTSKTERAQLSEYLVKLPWNPELQNAYGPLCTVMGEKYVVYLYGQFLVISKTIEKHRLALQDASRPTCSAAHRKELRRVARLKRDSLSEAARLCQDKLADLIILLEGHLGDLFRDASTRRKQVASIKDTVADKKAECRERYLGLRAADPQRKDGKVLEEIAAAMDTTDRTVRRWLKELGIK